MDPDTRSLLANMIIGLGIFLMGSTLILGAQPFQMLLWLLGGHELIAQKGGNQYLSLADFSLASLFYMGLFTGLIGIEERVRLKPNG